MPQHPRRSLLPIGRTTRHAISLDSTECSPKLCRSLVGIPCSMHIQLYLCSQLLMVSGSSAPRRAASYDLCSRAQDCGWSNSVDSQCLRDCGAVMALGFMTAKQNCICVFSDHKMSCRHPSFIRTIKAFPSHNLCTPMDNPTPPNTSAHTINRLEAEARIRRLMTRYGVSPASARNLQAAAA